MVSDGEGGTGVGDDGPDVGGVRKVDDVSVTGGGTMASGHLVRVGNFCWAVLRELRGGDGTEYWGGGAVKIVGGGGAEYW